MITLGNNENILLHDFNEMGTVQEVKCFAIIHIVREQTHFRDF